MPMSAYPADTMEDVGNADERLPAEFEEHEGNWQSSRIRNGAETGGLKGV